MAPSSPRNPLDRVALERVLARASEIQSQAGDGGDGTELMTEEQVVELGKEVGLSPEHLRQAMAEERARLGVVEERGLASRLLGAGIISASRTVRGRPDEVLATLDTWMQRDECLRIKRQVADRIVWQPRDDFMGMLRRNFQLGGTRYPLSRAGELAATVIPITNERVLVKLDANIASARSATARNATIVTGLGAAASGAAVLMGFFLPVALVPAVVLAGGSALESRRIHQAAVTRVRDAMEHYLDRAERGEAARPTLPSIVNAIVQALPRGR